MLNKIFPERLDNHYRGHKFALWLLYPITFMKVSISPAHIFRSDGGAQSVSNIPLDTYVSGAAENVIALMARMGLVQFLLGLLFVLVVFRYRKMIPLMYVLLVVEYLGNTGIGWMKPLITIGGSGAGPLHLVLFALSIIGLVLSLQGEADLPVQESASSA